MEKQPCSAHAAATPAFPDGKKGRDANPPQIKSDHIRSEAKDPADTLDGQNKQHQPRAVQIGNRLSAAPPNEECVPWFMPMALPRVGPEEAAAGAEGGHGFLKNVGRRERISGSGRFLEEGRKENGRWSLSALYTSSPPPGCCSCVGALALFTPR